MITLLMLALLQAVNPASELEKGRTLAIEGDLPGAVTVLQQVCDQFPTWGLAKIELANVLLMQEPTAPQLTQLVAAAVNLESTNPRAWMVAGRFHELQGEIETALDDYAHAISLRSELEEGHQKLAALLLKADRPAEAAQHYRDLLQMHPEDCGLRINLAEAYERAGEVKLAERELKSMVRSAPRNALHRQRLAAFYKRHGQRRKSLQQSRLTTDTQGSKRKMRPLLPSSR